MKAVIINGGYSVNSRLTGIEVEVEKLLSKTNTTYDKILVHKLPAEALITANYANPVIVENVKKVEDADVVILLTPVFKGAYSGILKTFLDLLRQKGFENKSVIPIAIGGSIAHLLSVDYALKPVVSILGATHVTNPVYVVDKLVTRVDDVYVIDGEITERLESTWKQVSGFASARV